MFGRKKSDKTIRNEAATWVTLLEGEIPQQQQQEFHSWLERDNRHEREFSQNQALVLTIQDLPADRKIELQSAATSAGALFGLPEPRLARRLQFAGIAVTAVTVAVIGAWLSFRPVREYFTQTYATEVGESRTVVLRDGSIAHLNTQSRIHWSGSRKDRRVTLDRGEVLFEVAHNPTQPFRVTVDNSEIRDLATEFDVYRKSNGSVIVTVISGKVAVKELTAGSEQPAWSERLLNPNEQIEYTPATLIADVHSIDPAKSVRWREGLLETEGQSFATTIAELNRYSNKPISIADPRLESLPSEYGVGGTLETHDIPAALQRIQKVLPLVVTDTDAAYILTYKADAPVTEHSTAPQQNAAGRP
jgi:transmembrane sensor